MRTRIFAALVAALALALPAASSAQTTMKKTYVGELQRIDPMSRELVIESEGDVLEFEIIPVTSYSDGEEIVGADFFEPGMEVRVKVQGESDAESKMVEMVTMLEPAPNVVAQRETAHVERTVHETAREMTESEPREYASTDWERPERLPATGSPLPLIGLGGAALLTSAGALRARNRR